MTLDYELAKKRVRRLVNDLRATHPERMDWTADEWIGEISGLARLTHKIHQNEKTESLAHLVDCPEVFHRIMIELEDERIFDEPELN